MSGWVETFPTKQETATVVAKKILEEIFQRFRVPQVIGSNNGLAFVSKVSQGLTEILQTNWKSFTYFLGSIVLPSCVRHCSSFSLGNSW